MNLSEFKNKVLSKFTEEITDIFFCYIESDKVLLQNYLTVIGREGNLDSTNQLLGKAIKEWFQLQNTDECKKPRSKLIKTYTMHRRSS